MMMNVSPLVVMEMRPVKIQLVAMCARALMVTLEMDITVQVWSQLVLHMNNI